MIELLLKALPISLYLSDCRYKDNLIKKLLYGLLARVYFISDITFLLKID